MGSLEGHLLPGTFILCFGIWWAYAVFDRYFQALVNSSVSGGHIRFECTATYSHFEGWLKIITTIIGIIAEFYTALDNDLNFTHIGNAQHITMYLFFLLSGVVDLLLHWGYPLPKGCDYMCLCLAVAVESLLFCFHLHGRTALDIHVHTLLIIASIASLFSGIIEWRFRHNVLSALFRALCTLLQGSWFCTVGFILYPPFSSRSVDESHTKLMLLTSVFCWEMAALIICMFVIGICFYCKNRRIIENKDFSNNGSINSFSDNDFKNMMNDSKADESKERFNRIKANSVNRFKYLSISTSDEEI